MYLPFPPFRLPGESLSFILLAPTFVRIHLPGRDAVRIIAGKYKGTTLRCGRGPVYRPTAQIVRGSIFDIIGGEVEGAAFLDLFAGSGAVGIEALSRGAARVLFVEQDHRVLKALRTNLQRCGITADQAIVRSHDAFRFLERLVGGDDFFDIVFADPPYGGKAAQRVVDLVEGAERPICTLLVVEHGEAIFNRSGGTLELLRTRKFGQTMVTYFKRGPLGGSERQGRRSGG
jgi:16S rRNA (guanine966-N2)-methyltransferase